MTMLGEPTPTGFNPLDQQPADPNLHREAQRNTVANICESYHGRYDSFAELLQNAVDAVARRWDAWDGPGHPVVDGNDTERPQIRVVIDCATNQLHVTDNGFGMDGEALQNALIPNVSDKAGDTNQRGHKGVGTAFLTYGHNLFEIESKTPAGVVGYRMNQGLTWAKTVPAGEPPLFGPLEGTGHLDDFGRGTRVTVQFGDGTNYGVLGGAGTPFNGLPLWDVVLRTFTAVGFIDLGSGTRPWHSEVRVSVDLQGAASAGVATVQFSFLYPHLQLDVADRSELQALQNSPNATNRYKLIYLQRNHQALMQLLQPELEALEARDADLYHQIRELLEAGEVAAYASLASTNTLYDENWKRSIGYPDAGRVTAINVKGGVLMASVGMPVGQLVSHRQLDLVLRPEDRRRYFLLVHVNHNYRPDVGRKTIPREWEPVVGWLEAALLRLLKQYTSRLETSNEDATHNAASFAQAQQQLNDATISLADGDAAATTLQIEGLVPRRKPLTEAEVVSQFVSLLSHGHLPGYKVIAIPGNESRYDGLVNVELDVPAEDMDAPHDVLSIRQSQFLNGAFLRTRQWLEFKRKLSTLIDEFELTDGLPNKKYYEQLNLVICYEAVLPTTIGGYSLTPIVDANLNERNFPGSTHFLSRDQAAHRIEVIELKTLFDQLQALGV